ncbi:MAG: CO dehydrogenase/CO-methylating acetyl-CoA synthase complex subunit beta [Oscillospiraceae bacterium]|jgi:acetyl-CoA synthase|nr:CO dehydrogenase/CO-methylating acetyl-CoA synthase complex subunit beta [Oscillospiraceae bacterium]
MALTDLIYGGANAVAGLTGSAVEAAIAKQGADAKIAFPDTAYFLPTIYAATGVKVKTLGDLTACVGVLKSLITNKAELGDALNAGLATAVGAEIIEALKWADSAAPYEGTDGIGFVPDPVIRSLGVPLVTGDIPGVAVILGEADDPKNLALVVKEYQQKGLLTFLVGGVIGQAAAEGVKTGLDYRVVPLGHDVTAVTHVVTVAIRAALIFGAVPAGDLAALLAYTKERVLAFVNVFGALDEVTVAAGAGAIALGFPVITDQDIGGLAIPGALEYSADPLETVARSLSLRGIKVKTKEIDICMGFASAFEGEIIKKADTYVEFYSGSNPTAELVVMRSAGELGAQQQGYVNIIGADVGSGIENTGELASFPLATFVEVAGAKMQTDFEPVIERKIHHWFNYVEGVMHTGQRNLFRLRISKEAAARGLNLSQLGEMLHHEILDEFGSVVDSCRVTFITDKAKVQKLLDEEATPRYRARDERTASMTDESVDTFYTCVLCQSFAPSHCCVVTPERLGLCGAVSWLDAKATKELTPTGPNQPIPKTGLTDERAGRYTAVNEAVADATHGAVSDVTLYSILNDPMTSCGCFECICGILPEAKGVIVVNREYSGATPSGMTFGELASMTGGGVQTPGFMGHGRHFIASKKFAAAEGGIERIVWMPKELKDDVRPRLDKTAKELYGIDGFTDLVCDETIATDSDGVLEYLTKAGHPALKLAEIM